jgi:hypothetical protein
MIGENFFPPTIADKYSIFLHHKNYPLPTMYQYLHETIQSFTIPGLNLQTLQISGLNNTSMMSPGTENFDHPVTQRTYSGSVPYNEIISQLTIDIVFKNTILNWLYCFEWLYAYYKRRRSVHEFDIVIDMLDSAEIPIVRFHLIDSYLYKLPDLEFAYNNTFSETKTFDGGFVFNRFEVEILVPDFNVETMKF